MRRPLIPVLSFPVAALSLAVACTGAKRDAAADSAQAAAASVAPPAAPTLAAIIKSPSRGDTTGADVTVVLGQEGVTIAKADGKRVEGIGHYHLFLDTAPTADSIPIPAATKVIVHIGTGDSTYTFKGLTPGQHQLIAVIGYGDHTPMATRRDTVQFVVRR